MTTTVAIGSTIRLRRGGVRLGRRLLILERLALVRRLGAHRVINAMPIL